MSYPTVFTCGHIIMINRHLGQAHIETQADARQGRAGQGDAARETLRDTV